MSTTLNIINYIEEKYGELFNKNEKIIIFRSNKWSVRYKIFDNTSLIINNIDDELWTITMDNGSNISFYKYEIYNIEKFNIIVNAIKQKIHNDNNYLNNQFNKFFI